MNGSDAKILAAFVKRYYDVFEGWLDQQDIDPVEGTVIVETLESIANKEESDVARENHERE